MGINKAEMKEYWNEVELEAKTLYWDVYGKVVEYKNFKGEPMPEWEKLPGAIQEAWMAVARNKIAAVYKCTKKLEASQEKINDLKEEKDGLIEEINDLGIEIDDLKKERDDLKEKIYVFEIEIHDLKEEVSELEIDIDSLNIEKAELEDRLAERE